METDTNMVEEVTKSEIMGLMSWDKPRTAKQLMNFISRREADIFATDV
jgi:hypothetical protein